jgi:AcrR family transcriptional regulator
MSSKKDESIIALRIFFQKGYDSTSINDIISECQISKGGLYCQFINKEKIFIEAIDYLFEELEKYGKSLFIETKNIKNIIYSYFNSLTDISNILKEILGSKNIKMENFYMLITNAFIKFPSIKEKYIKLNEAIQKLLINTLKSARENGEIKCNIDCNIISFMINIIVEGFLYIIVQLKSLKLKKIMKKYSIISGM